MSEHTPHATANMLGITPVTLRRWCAAHAAFLSAGANPAERGEARRFTGRDIEVLKHVKSLRAQGKTEAKINEQLVTITFPEIETSAHKDANVIVSAIPDAPDGVRSDLAPIAIVDDLQTRVALLERSSSEAQKEQRGFVQGLAIGFIGAALFFLILVLLISIYH